MLDYKKLDELKFIKLLKETSDSYYNEGKITVTDAEFDEMKDYFEITFPNSPYLSEIGVKVPNGSPFVKMRHNILMGSQSKVTYDEGLPAIKKWMTLSNIKQLIVEYKYDGISIELVYEKGKLVNAITRGDGIEGLDIYSNIIHSQDIILDMNNNFTGSIHCEAILKLSDLKTLNEIFKTMGKKPISNARNGIAGICNRLDSTSSNYISLRCYDVEDGTKFKTEEEKMKKIDSIGFPTFYKIINTIEELEEFYKEIEDSRDDLDFLIDGIVLKTNSIKQLNELGVVNKKPKGQIAWKFENKGSSTEVLSISWQVGASGVITPVANLEPVEIDSSEIARASLKNIDIFNDLKLYKDCRVEVTKRNDVIPNIEQVLADNVEEDDKVYFEVPDKCPSCGGKAEVTTAGVKSSGKVLKCMNPNCGAKSVKEILKYIKKLELKGLGDKFITNAFEAGLLSDISDLYELSINEMVELPRMGVKSATKIYNTINDNKKVKLELFIAGLNISGFSTSIAELIINHGFDTLEKIRKIKYKELVDIKGIEDTTANKIINGLVDKGPIIDMLIDKGIETFVDEPEELIITENLESSSFCFTGKIESVDENGDRYTRKKLEKIVEETGNIVAKSVTKTLDYLVVADPNSTSSKVKKAKKDGIKVISEEEFFEIVGR